MSTVRIVAFLGKFEDRPSYPAYEFVWKGQALSAAAAPIHVGIWTEVARQLGDERPALMLLGTKKARKEWIDNDRFMTLLNEATGGAEIGPVWFREYEIAGSGENDTRKQSWDLFDALRSALGSNEFDPASPPERGEPWKLVDAGLGDGPVPRASTVLFDVTRGFRASPILGCSALSLVLADERRRRRDAQAPETSYHLLYAAAEENEALAPVWDLTTFVEATQVSAGTHSLSRHGRGDELADVLEASPHSESSGLGKQLRGFSDDIRMMRVPQLLERTGPELLVALHRDARAVASVYPPVRALATRLEKHLGRIFPQGTGVAPVSAQGVVGAWALARWLVEMDLVPFAVGLLRESIITAWTLAAKRRPPTEQLQPGASAFDKQRGADDAEMYNSVAELLKRKADTEDHFAKICDRTSTSTIPFQLALLAAHAFDLRNDILHCGFRAAPKQREVLLEKFAIYLATAERITAEALAGAT